MVSGTRQAVIHWMNEAYAYAAQGNPEATFESWKRAYDAAEQNEQKWLDEVERRRILDEAYETSARSCLQTAVGLYDRELWESTKDIPFHVHEHRRNQRVVEWEHLINRAYGHAYEISHRALITGIQEVRTKPLRPLWRSRMKQVWLFV